MIRVKHIMAAVLLVLLPFFVSEANEIRNLDIVVGLRSDGSASVVQKWSVYIDEGTEWYVPVENLKDMSLGNLKVSENGVAFESDGDLWDSSRSRSEKKGRSGIVRKSKGIELCWGIGDYGNHEWTVEYELGGLVKAYEDYDGFNFMFINKGMSPAPERAVLTIRNETESGGWTSDNVKVWGFGLYGNIEVRDGSIVEESLEPMSSRSSMIALVRFDKGLLNPSVSAQGTFQAVLDKALEGSSYGENERDTLIQIIFGICILLCLLALIVFLIVEKIRGRVYRKALFGQYKIDGWFREAPFGGDLASNVFVLNHSNRFGVNKRPDGTLIGAYFLKWILSGDVTAVPDSKNGKRMNIVFPEQLRPFDSETETELYEMALKAAGQNRILEKKELGSWARKNAEKISDWPSKVDQAGEVKLIQDKVVGAFKRAVPGKEAELRRVIEFRNFLKDYTLIGERSTADVALWKNYLIFAQLFGIADKVAEQFKNLYPDSFGEVETLAGGNLTRTLLIANTYSRSLYTTAYAKYTAGSVSGKGGHTSFGGGGGFSGGGFGGGAR